MAKEIVDLNQTANTNDKRLAVKVWLSGQMKTTCRQFWKLIVIF